MNEHVKKKHTLGGIFVMERALSITVLIVFIFAAAEKRRLLAICPIAALALAACASTACASMRILSLAPPATEILFHLGLGEQVIGVTQYCDWPPEAAELPKFANMMNISVEAVAKMRPDLIVLSDMNEAQAKPLADFGMNTAIIRQQSFADICEAMEELGRLCGVEATADASVRELRAEYDAATVPPADSPPRVLIVVSRDAPGSEFRKLYAAGRSSFYSELIERAGCVNALESKSAYEGLSREGVLRIDPDIIIELLGAHGPDTPDEATAISAWNAFDDLRAAREGRVSFITGGFAMRAGTRLPALLRAVVMCARDGARYVREEDAAR